MGVRCFMVESLWEAIQRGTGAMTWRRHAYLDHDTERRPMPHLVVMTPPGMVCLDCPESDSPAHWMRTGEPPNITVTPSLNVNDNEWHGWLTGGELTPPVAAP